MNKLYEEGDVQALANGVRTLTGKTDTFTLAEMVTEVSDYWGDFSLIQNSIEDNDQPFNGGLGYQDGYRINSGGLKAASDKSCCTGWFPVETGDILRIKFPLVSTLSLWYINLYNANKEQVAIIQLSLPSGLHSAVEVLITHADVKFCRFAVADSVDAVSRMLATTVKVIKGG